MPAGRFLSRPKSLQRAARWVISPPALEAVRRIHALFEIERPINGQSAERRRASGTTERAAGR
jgi:hypothetical protein